MDEVAKELLDEAFATGATSVSVRRWIDGTYRADISAFVHHSEGKRSASSGAVASGEGATPSEALRDALAQLPRPEPELAESDSVETSELATQEQGVLVPEREVLEPEVLDPKLRYAVVGRPGQFVTREEARGHR